jgi:hypothetical protein
MQRKGQLKLLVLITLQLLWGLVLLFSISKYGLGVSTDAVSLLFGGLNLASGNGLTGYDGSFLVLWPPLYPALLGTLHRVTGLEMLGAAALLQVLAYLCVSISLSILLLKIFRDNFGLALIATLLAQAGSVMVIAFGMVGSDFVHYALVVVLLALTGHYLETGSTRGFVALAMAAMLTSMQRYLGVAALASSAVAITLLGPGTVRRRLANTLVLGSTVLPMVIWLAVTSPLYSLRDPISLAENFGWFSRSILQWFLAPGLPKKVLEQYVPLLWMVCIVLALVVVLLALSRGRLSAIRRSRAEAQGADTWAYLLPLLLYGSFYALALFGSASMAYFNKLGGRFLLPLYLPLILLPVVVADLLIRLTQGSVALGISAKIAGHLVSILLAAAVMRNSIPVLIESRLNGAAGGENAYNNRTWRENPAIQFWADHTPSNPYLLFTNEPDGVALNTQHPAFPAPRRMSGPYGTEEIPISSYHSELFGSGRDIYLIWIQPSPYEHYYEPAELEAIASVEPLLISPEGSVYRLHARERN